MTDERKVPSRSSRQDIDAFIQKVVATPVTKAAGRRGRLIFALDATASRAPTWDRACHLQAEMFKETGSLGGLDIQLVYYRGFGQCRASKWTSNADDLLRIMTRVMCLGGLTQIRKILRHALKETKREKVDAVVFVGDCVEEDVDELCHHAGELGLVGVPVFVFHEGGAPAPAQCLRQIAKLSGGAYCPFDEGSAQQMRELLGAVAVYAAGGRKALADFGRKRGGLALQLTHQIR